MVHTESEGSSLCANATGALAARGLAGCCHWQCPGRAGGRCWRQAAPRPWPPLAGHAVAS